MRTLACPYCNQEIPLQKWVRAHNTHPENGGNKVVEKYGPEWMSEISKRRKNHNGGRKPRPRVRRAS